MALLKADRPTANDDLVFKKPLTRSQAQQFNFQQQQHQQPLKLAEKKPLNVRNDANYPAIAVPVKDNLMDNKENLPVPSKQSSKNLCASPPAILKDKKATVSFTKGKLLGEGGFARCYEVWDSMGKRFAAKVISKSSLKSPKSKQKLFTEIKIHQNMRHPHIVQFHHVFEDSQNVYMILELCENKTFVDLMKKKKRLTEAEAIFYGKQLLDAIGYMHKKRVIHRDLKLGNMFFNTHMDIKLGDFGLATVLTDSNERKKTICGTPNYIAPEILFDRKNGHSYEVDMWSFGVILYTMIVGKPPFQTKDVQEIYKKIKENDYQFPTSLSISPLAKDLIKSLLTTNPALRPTLDEILAHPWFNTNNMKSVLPITANDFKSSSAIPLKEISLSTKPMKTSPNVLTPIKIDKNVAPPIINLKQQQNIDHVVHCPPIKNVENPAILMNANDAKLMNVHLSPKTATTTRKSMLESILFNLKKGLSDIKSGYFSEDLRLSKAEITAPKIFISKWIDYSNKYGLGYQLTNGCVGVYFNDSTSIILSANECNLEYLEYAKGTDKTIMNRQGHVITKYPDSLQKKVTLLKYFKGYMQENLSKASQYCFQDLQKTTNLDFLVKYMRTKHAVMFRLTNQIVQVNFFDHTKLILAHNGLLISFIDRERILHNFSLYDVLMMKRTDVISRLKYTRDILENLKK